MTEEDKKILEQFPEYDKNPAHFTESRQYWATIFATETNRDPEVHKEFSELHHKLVDEVIQFCKKHNLEVDRFSISADGLLGSREFGKWCPCTDSSMSMRLENQKRGDNPFLYEI